MKIIKNIAVSIFVMLVLIFISSFIGSVKNDELERAYKKKSIKLVDKFINKHRLKCSSIDNDTSNHINSLLNEFVKIYSGEVHVDPNKFDNPNPPGNEKFIVMQPEIEVGLVNYNLDASNSYTFKKLKPKPGFLAYEDPYPFKGVYRSFTSSASLTLEGIVSPKKRTYCVDNTIQYQVIRVDTSLIRTVRNFLKRSGIEHKERADFIHKSVNLVKTQVVDQDPVGGKFHYMAFNYNFYIERIVFDKSLNYAWIQFSFFSQSNEATFSKEGDKWKLQKSQALQHIN